MENTPNDPPQHRGFVDECPHPECVQARYIAEVQRLHDEHAARCHLCKVADYCVVAEQRKAVLDAWNE